MSAKKNKLCVNCNKVLYRVRAKTEKGHNFAGEEPIHFLVEKKLRLDRILKDEYRYTIGVYITNHNNKDLLLTFQDQSSNILSISPLTFKLQSSSRKGEIVKFQISEKGAVAVQFSFRLRVKGVDTERTTNRVTIEMGDLKQ